MHIPRNVEGGDSCPDKTKHQIHFCCNSLVGSGENAGWAYTNWNSFISFTLGSWPSLSLPAENVDQFKALTFFYPVSSISFIFVSTGSRGPGLQSCLRAIFCLNRSYNWTSTSFSVGYSLRTLFWLWDVVKLSKYDEREDFKTLPENYYWCLKSSCLLQFILNHMAVQNSYQEGWYSLVHL